MKYDFSRCNNLMWEYVDETERHNGFCRIFDDRDEVKTWSFIEMTNMPHGLQRENTFACFSLDKEDVCDTYFKNFRIIPRDPDTYTDWQVGDEVRITNEEDCDYDKIVIVAARINDIVICKYRYTPEVYGIFTCEELKSLGNLILTDYEKKLACESECEFKEGDTVLVRDRECDKWVAGIFSGIAEGAYCKYSVFNNGHTRYKQCIPYNEKTWRLLGTTDKYEEE